MIAALTALLLGATLAAPAPHLNRTRPAPPPPPDRILRTEVSVAAPIDSVWNAFTTEAGARTFFAPGGKIEARVDGPYEIWFNPAGEPGMRGGDFMRVLALEPPRRLAFTWNAPPSQPYTRAQRTMVEVVLTPVGIRETRVRLTHMGFGYGPEWDKTYAYFDHAWRAQVLPFLIYRFAHGPVDWEHPPEVAAVGGTMQMELVPARGRAGAK